MKLIIDDKPVRISNFVNYLVENYTEKDKIYDFELKAEDKYDMRFIIEKDVALKNKVLVMHNDGFDIFGKTILEDFDDFKKAVENLIGSKIFNDLYTLENFKKQFVHFNVKVLDIEAEKGFLFHFLNVSRADSK